MGKNDVADVSLEPECAAEDAAAKLETCPPRASPLLTRDC